MKKKIVSGNFLGSSEIFEFFIFYGALVETKKNNLYILRFQSNSIQDRYLISLNQKIVQPLKFCFQELK